MAEEKQPGIIEGIISDFRSDCKYYSGVIRDFVLDYFTPEEFPDIDEHAFDDSCPLPTDEEIRKELDDAEKRRKELARKKEEE